MSAPCRLISTVLLVVIGVIHSSSFAAAPELFSKKKFDDAKAEAKAANKLFIADATAVWCGPCKRMDKTTWVDEKVVVWVKEHAIAIQFDVDQEKKRAESLSITAMPTIIMYKDGEEFDRVVGYRTAEELLAWLNGATQGKRDIDTVREAAGDRNDPNAKIDIESRYKLAMSLDRSGKLDEATAEYVWLWDNMLKYNPSYVGVRLSFMVNSMKQLAARHEPAKAAFTKLRDHAQIDFDAGKASRETMVDWVKLNDVIGDEGATLGWFDKVKDDDTKAEVIGRIDRELFELLIERERWADAGRVNRDPVGSAQMRLDVLSIPGPQGMSDDEKAGLKEYQVRATIDELSKFYAACLAAAREKPAQDIAVLLLKSQDTATARIALVQTAQRAGQPRQQHLQWLDEAAAKGDGDDVLRKRVERALASKKAQNDVKPQTPSP